MAIPQTIIPVLTGDAAERFSEIAEKGVKQRGSKYNPQAQEEAKKIIEKSRSLGYF